MEECKPITVKHDNGIDMLITTGGDGTHFAGIYTLMRDGQRLGRHTLLGTYNSQQAAHDASIGEAKVAAAKLGGGEVGNG